MSDESEEPKGIVCPICGELCIEEQCKVICISDTCIKRVIENCDGD